MHRTDIDNTERLQALRGVSGYEKFSNTLDINVSYVFEYMENGKKPSKKTENGKEARKALGIETVGLSYTRERRASLNRYAQEKGFTSWSAVETLINDGGDPLKDFPATKNK